MCWLCETRAREAIDVYKKAINIIPGPVRADTLISPIRTWKELLTAGNLQDRVCTNGEDILSLLESSLRPSTG